MIIQRTDSASADFIRLRTELDQELNERYGTSQAEYDRHNRIENIDTVLVGYLNNAPIACGCFKPVDDQTIEIKRMFVKRNLRRKGFSRLLLSSLEKWASEQGYTRAVLETGRGQPEAIRLYQTNGYSPIEKYGPYKGLENSVCMAKPIGAEPARQ